MDLLSISKVLAEAAALPPSNKGGMLISFPGTLSHAQRSLMEMAQPFEDAPTHLEEEFDERISDAQPALRAYGLEQMGKHLAMLKIVFQTGDAQTVRRFFDLYVFD